MALRFKIMALEPSPAGERALELDENLTEIRFGRRAGLEVSLPFPALAPVHARMLRDQTGWRIEDLGGAGGTWLEGRRLDPGAKIPVTPGQTLTLAHVSIVFEGAAPSDRAAEGTGTIARRLVSDLFRVSDNGQVPRLLSLAGAEALRLAIPDRPYLVGRAESCDLVLSTEEISREHATLVRRWEGVHIQDLGSKNGVKVAGQPISGQRRLRDGERIEIGSVEYQLDDPEDRYLRQIEESDGAPPAAPRPIDRPEEEIAAAPRRAFPPRRRGAAATMWAAAFVLAVIVGLAIALIAAS